MGRRSNPRSGASAEEAALRSSLERLDRFVETLGARCEAARDRAEAGVKRPRSEGRAQRDLEQTWADYEAARRLRDTVAAALASAEARVALIEAEVSATVAAAFEQLEADRGFRRRAARPGGARGRSRGAAAKPRSPEELAEMVALARRAVVYVIVDRNRLTARLVDIRAETAELRARLAAAPEASEMIRERIAMWEQQGTYVERQLLASARVTQKLLAGLRELIRGLPEPVASALARLEAREPFVRDEN